MSAQRECEQGICDPDYKCVELLGVILTQNIRKAQQAWSSCCAATLGTDILEGTSRVTVLSLCALLVQKYKY